MSEELKQTPEHIEIKTRYDNYNVSKYKKWATGSNKSTEQIKFEEYLKTVEPHKMTVVEITPVNNGRYEQIIEKATNSRQKVYLNSNTDVNNKLRRGDYVIIPFKKGMITDKLETTVNIYGRVIGYGGLTNQLDFDGLGYSVGIDTMTTKEIESYVQQYAAGGQSPTPSTPSNGINIPEYDREKYTQQGSEEEAGQYGLNLIDYRDIAKSTQLGLAGTHIKVKAQSSKGGTVQAKTDGFVIFNKYPHLNGSDINTKHYGGSTGISGIKKGIQITFNNYWIPIPETDPNDEHNGELILNIINEDISGGSYEVEQEQIKFTHQVESSKHQPSKFGHYQIEVGTNSVGGGDKPDKYMLQFKARYGTLPTKTNRRTFEFKEYKGHTLRANGYGLQDKYYKHPMGNVLVRKVGHINFTDLVWFHGYHIADQDAHYIYAKVPVDCKVPKGSAHESQQQMEELGKKLMTNNLTEVPPTQLGHPEHIELLPVDKNPPYLEQLLTPLPTTESKPVWCFVLLTTAENAKRYYDLLSKTEITYELADEYQKPIYLQEGGFDIVLNNGTVIHSNQYKKIEKKADQNAYKLTDLAGNVTKININQIVETIGVE